MPGKRIELQKASGSDYLTIDETAHELGIKPAVVRNYLYEGKFRTYKFKTLTLVSKRDVEAWKSHRQR